MPEEAKKKVLADEDITLSTVKNHVNASPKSKNQQILDPRKENLEN